MADDEDRELFERALESVSPADVYRGKYGEPADESESNESENEADAVDAEELQRRRDQRMMEDVFGGEVDRIDQDKYYRREPDKPDLDVTTEDFAAALEGDVPNAPEQPPEPDREPSLAELASEDVESINLRGKEPDEGVRELAVFVDLASKDDVPIIQIKVGSNPELRDELLEWFRDAGAIYARKVEVVDPESDSALFVKLRPAT